MDFSTKNIAVFGMGKSGISALRLLKHLGANPSAISAGEVDCWSNLDEVLGIIPKSSCFSQDDSKDLFANSDLIILSPGIPREHELLEKAVERGVPIWSEIELAYTQLKIPAPIIAVTGTNGKTTTVTMIGEALKLSGFNTFVGGNIGIPFCDYILDGEGADYIVLELSSFQLESTPTFRPNIAMILNVFPNHGERYEGIADYAGAKFNISNNMESSDSVILPINDVHLRSWGASLKTKVVQIDASNPKTARGLIERSCNLEQFKLQGGHNITNLLFVVKTIETLGVSNHGLQQMINTFGGVEFRVQYIDGPDHFTAFNDAKSTNWDAVKTAVNAIDKGDRDLHLIVGGQRRGQGDTLIPHFNVIKKVDKILLIGETTDQFATELEGEIEYIKCYDLKTAIEYEREESFRGILLFSPGLPSYDQYDNYIKRGLHFTELVGNK